MSHTAIEDLEKIIIQIRKVTDIPICLDSEGAQLRNQEMEGGEVSFHLGETIKIHFDENDTLIIITLDKVTNNIFEEFLENIYQNNKIFIQLFWIESLMIDITQHSLVPKHTLISEEEKEEILENYSLSTYTQLPIILKNDPVAKYHGGKRGDIFKIIRPSETSGEYLTYRYCQ